MKYTESHRWCSLALQFTARSPSPRKVKATHRLPHREQMAEWELEIRCPDVPYTALSTPPQNSLNPGTRYHIKRFILNVFYFKKRFYLFLERERNINVWLPLVCPLLENWPTTQACALDWESNWWPLGSQAHSTEPHQPGLNVFH